MKLKVTQENLNKALSVVSRVAAAKASLPILSNILIRTNKNRLTVTSTNLEIAVETTIGGKVEEEGSITVPARLMSDFVSSLPSDNIELSLDGNSLNIKTPQYTSLINGVSPEDFPTIPKVKSDTKHKMGAGELKEVLQQTVFAASGDEARQILTGVFVHSHNKKLYFVATDSYRLAEKDIGKTNDDVSAVIPASSLQELLRILPDDESDVEVVFDEGQVMFRFDDIELISRLVDGKYPDYRQLIPKESDSSFTISKKEFTNITKVSSLFARESAGSITVNVSEDDQEVSINSVASQVGENTSKAKAKIKGSGEVTLNSRYLLDALNAFDGDSLTFSFSGKLNPCVLTSSQSKDYLHIVMPLRS